MPVNYLASLCELVRRLEIFLKSDAKYISYCIARMGLGDYHADHLNKALTETDHMYKLACIALALTALTACTTTDPYTRESETSKAAKGAAIGAAAAAVVAAIESRDDDSRKRNERVLKSAAVGAAIGGGIGYYMDVQEAKLREKLENTGVSVLREGDNLTLVMPGHITFATDSDSLRGDFNDVLNSVSMVLNEFDKTNIAVSGHTDSTGSDSYNQSLSERRADSVAAQLAAEGVSDVRIAVAGYGESRPIADNATASGRQQNRRVELELVHMDAE
jgi:outer membrane protein OmpA-like peptidoglycan-associated protein